MLQRAFNVRLDKSLQRTDWTRRPLPTAMVSYAARDAEMTLALYYWLEKHYRWALQLHEHTGQQELVAVWMEPFLRGALPVPTEVAIAGIQGLLSEEELYADCRTALATLAQPMRRNRLLRLIADLSLVQLAPEIEPLLHAQASEERAAAARTLSRLHVEDAIGERALQHHLRLVLERVGKNTGVVRRDDLAVVFHVKAVLKRIRIPRPGFRGHEAVELELLALPRLRIRHDLINVLVVLGALAERRIQEAAKRQDEDEARHPELHGFLTHR